MKKLGNKGIFIRFELSLILINKNKTEIKSPNPLI
jgi:hypothetical protein